jgi:hypothetical protein
VSHSVISSILRHDSKQTSYKIALLRAINDVVLAYPDVAPTSGVVAVPLRMLAECWVAYYWPFVDPRAPILQGVRSLTRGSADVAFRPELSALRSNWEAIYGPSGAAGGWHLVEQMRLARFRATYPSDLRKRYRGALRKIGTALRQPIRYAGSGTTRVFADPAQLASLPHATPLPGAEPNEVCLSVPAGIWTTFRDVSLWVEALCIHEWSQLTERLAGDSSVGRGEVYALLTERPDNRLPLQWERNEVNLLMLEGHTFTCPWTARRLTLHDYDLDHIVPLAIHPFHELWNLVPADPDFNRHRKRDRLPSAAAMAGATPQLLAAYGGYQRSRALAEAFGADVALRFSRTAPEPTAVAVAVGALVASIAAARNVARF